MKKDFKFFWTLFVSTFTLSAFTFGGGYVIVPLMRKKFVETLKWIEEDEMMDLISIAQSAPGPIAVNSSIIIGYRLAGVPGALVTVFGTVLPPMVVLSVISQFYTAFRDNVIVSLVLKGMGIGVAGGYVISLLTGAVNPEAYLTGIRYDFKPFYITYSLVKSSVFAFIITSISGFYGYYAKGNSLEVGRASTKAVVVSSIVILIFNLILTQIMLT